MQNQYKPKIVTGRVKGTGYPIDGRVLYFSLWDYDKHESFHLYGWEEADDEAVMLTMYQAEREAGECTCDTPEAFAEKWKAKEWEPAAAFCLPLDKVEVQEVKQEEEKSDAREKLLARGSNIKARPPHWERIECPACGRGCWKPAGVDELVEKQGVQLLCTECALEAGLVKPHRPIAAKPTGNRAQRRRAKRLKREGKA